jgi:NAD(P)-dependent dehydrogenase (short-subunit alcohol dehydrogenase family)
MTSSKSSSRKVVLVLGGTSDIGRATARAFAQAGWDVQLAGRDVAALEPDVADLKARYAIDVTTYRFDVLDTASFQGFVGGLSALPDAVVSIVGLLGSQPTAESDLDHATTIMRSNYEGPALILGLFAEKFLARGTGSIVGVSSVAGDRGRASNYVYGSAKAGFSAFLSGLRARASSKGVHVITVKPGFVRTKMTEGMKLIGPLTVDAPVVGNAILDAVQRKSDVVYVSRKWQLVMLIIKALPEAVFKKLKF